MTLDSNSAITQLKYLPSNTVISTVNPTSTNIANTGPGDTLDYPTNLSSSDISATVKNLVYTYSTPGKSSTMQVTTHPDFLEFDLTGTTGSPGDIRMFGPSFTNGASSFNTYAGSNGGRVDFMDIGNGLFLGIVAGNYQTHINNWGALIAAASPGTLPPTAVPYARGQKFAIFVTNATGLHQRIADIEANFNIPYGIAIKDQPQNNQNYLFLTNITGATAQNIIDLCNQIGFKNVLLEQNIWADWSNPSAPFLIRPGIQQLIADLKAAGLTVGLHAFVDKVPINGYYATQYPSMVSKVSSGVGWSYTFNNDLVDIMAKDFAARAKTLGAQWFYFDGDEQLYTPSGGQPTDTLDWYFAPLVMGTVTQELKNVGIMPVILQTSTRNVNVSHYSSRVLQTDYWDNPPTTPTSIIDSIVSIAPAARAKGSRLLTSDGLTPTFIRCPARARPL